MHDDSFDDGRRRKGRKRRRSKRRHHRQRHAWDSWSPDREDGLDESRLSIEERAERRVELTGDLLKFAAITLALLIFIPPAGFFVFIFWGLGLGKRVYRQWIEPELRVRFVEREVDKQVQDTLSRERRELSGEHARSLEQLSASIAHEIRNPITAAKSLVQQMEEDPTARENVEYARVALEELHRVERSVSHLLRFARDEEMTVLEVRLADVIDSALETFKDRAARSGIDLRHQYDCDGIVLGDAEKLRRVVINLTANAIDALKSAEISDPRVDVQMGENLAGTEVWVRVADNGPGIDPEALEKMWSPFYTSKAAGTGLGLAICRKLVDAHGGRIEVESSADEGTAFVLTFPRSDRIAEFDVPVEEGSSS